MRWFKIPKPRIPQPRAGTYREWKPQLAEEGSHQCVYCAISEGNGGGYRSFHVEHYRPKSKYRELENTIANLFYSCAICNSFKLNDWPGDPTPALDAPSYPDPSEVDYGEFIRVADDGSVDGETVAAKYVVERLFLNRPQLVMTRREVAALRAASASREMMMTLLNQNDVQHHLSRELGPQILAEVMRGHRLLAMKGEIPPYGHDDVRRQAE